MSSDRRRGSRKSSSKGPSVPSENGPRRILLEDDDVGKKVKESKKQVTWQFTYSADERATVHSVVLFHSIVSGKRKIMYNNNIIFEHKDLGSRIKNG